MWQNLTVNTKPRPSLCVGLLLCLDVVTCLAYPQQTSKPQEACDARVIAIQGGWVANPGSRSLSNWSCVKAGEDVVLVDGSPSGSITVIYHRGARQPDTTTCRSHAECRNAYRVKSSAVEPDMPQSIGDKILDFIFSIFSGGEPKPVPGILQGYVPQQPALACSVGRTADLKNVLGPGPYKYISVEPLNSEAQKAHWEAGAPANGTYYVGGMAAGAVEQSHSAPEKRGLPYSPLTITTALQDPALYELKTQLASRNGQENSMWLLIAPELQCDPLMKSYQQAVQFSNGWPKNTPREAIQNFVLAYLYGLATNPDKAPQ